MSKESLEQALLRNRAAHIVSSWLELLSHACGHTITADQLLTVEQTAQLRSRMLPLLKQHHAGSRKVWWQAHEFHEIESRLADLSHTMCGTMIVLFSSVDQVIGAVRLPADAVLKRSEAVWRVVQQDLILTTDDLKSGMCLEKNFYTAAGEYVESGIYELTAWGAFDPLTQQR